MRGLADLGEHVGGVLGRGRIAGVGEGEQPRARRHQALGRIVGGGVARPRRYQAAASSRRPSNSAKLPQIVPTSGGSSPPARSHDLASARPARAPASATSPAIHAA